MNKFFWVLAAAMLAACAQPQQTRPPVQQPPVSSTFQSPKSPTTASLASPAANVAAYSFHVAHHEPTWLELWPGLYGSDGEVIARAERSELLWMPVRDHFVAKVWIPQHVLGNLDAVHVTSGSDHLNIRPQHMQHLRKVMHVPQSDMGCMDNNRVCRSWGYN